MADALGAGGRRLESYRHDHLKRHKNGMLAWLTGIPFSFAFGIVHLNQGCS